MNRLMSRLSTMRLFPTCCPGWGSRIGKPTTFYSGINQPKIIHWFICYLIAFKSLDMASLWFLLPGAMLLDMLGKGPIHMLMVLRVAVGSLLSTYLFSPPTSSPSSHPPLSSSPSTLILKRRVRWLAQTLMVELTLIEDTASGNKCFATHTRWVLVGFSWFWWVLVGFGGF